MLSWSCQCYLEGNGRNPVYTELERRPMTSAMDSIQALVVGGSPITTRSTNGEFSLGAPITTITAELNEAFAVLSSRFYDVVLLNADLLGTAAEQIIQKIVLLSPGSVIVVFDEDEDEDRLLQLIKMGAGECLTIQESNPVNLRKTILKLLERNDGAGWLSDQISQALLGSTFEGVVVCDENLQVLLWNPAMERIFEIDRNEATGRFFEETFAGLSLTNENEEIGRALQGKRVISRERYFHNEATGKNGFFTAFYSPMRNRRGEIVGVLGIVKDVTNSKINERKSSEMAQRLVALTNASSNMQWLSDSSDNRVFFNKRWLEFVGNLLDDERGCGWRRHVHPEDLKRYRETSENAFESRTPWHIEVRLKGSNGHYVRYFESAFPLFLVDQSFIGYVGYCTDINGGRVTDPRVPAVDLTSTTFNSLAMSPIGILNLDKDLIVRNANQRIEDLFCIPVKELIGKKISDILGAFDLTTLQVVLSRAERIQLDNHKVVLETESGESVRYWDISLWPQRLDADNATGVCMSFIEATERYESSQQKEEFIAALVHDLKTPLIGAEQTLEAMLTGAMGPVYAGHEQVLSVLQNSNRSLLAMVQNMIDLHRCENDILQLSQQPIKIAALARECTEELRALFNSHGIQLKCLVDLKAESLSVMGDRMAIRRVILNLLDNALKFTPFGGSVAISIRSDADAIRLDIADTGIGISEAECEKIFTKSFQGKMGRQIHGSAGIGLFVCRKIIRAHSGDITVSKNALNGSTFTIEFPLCSKQEISCQPRNIDKAGCNQG
ncbi:MAG: hypothetical protein C0507_06015 [Cyanobacteria bacterium PR.3.49]|nr:hypothetical protein [Cyanobacteria bacterium PR.3.49]